jgi:lipoate synthase
MKREDERGEPPLWAVAVVALVLAFVVMAMTGCSSLKVEGACTYTRTVETSYQCEPGSTLEHTRVAPGSAPE